MPPQPMPQQTNGFYFRFQAYQFSDNPKGTTTILTCRLLADPDQKYDTFHFQI